jgi:hypothetical protein
LLHLLKKRGKAISELHFAESKKIEVQIAEEAKNF